MFGDDRLHQVFDGCQPCQRAVWFHRRARWSRDVLTRLECGLGMCGISCNFMQLFRTGECLQQLWVMWKEVSSTKLVSGINLTPRHTSLWSAFATNSRVPTILPLRVPSSFNFKPSSHMGTCLKCVCVCIRERERVCYRGEAACFSSMQIIHCLQSSPSWRDALEYWQVRRAGR